MLVIDEFMPASMSERLYAFLQHMPAFGWHVVVNDSPSYRFRRLRRNHYAFCQCAVCAGFSWLASHEVREGLAAIIGGRTATPLEMFASWYAPGDFLEPHTDAANGDVAFALSLTKDWRLDFGGLLHLLPEDRPGTECVVLPTFNRMVAFEVAESRTPHFVSRVLTSATTRRLMISGWYRIHS